MVIAKQFSKYGGIAVGSALTDYALFSVLLLLEVNILVAQGVARIAGGIFSFLFNKYWNFETNSLIDAVREARRFLILYATSYTIALGLFYGFIEVFNFGAYSSKIMIDITIFIFNFTVMRLYVFNGKAN